MTLNKTKTINNVFSSCLHMRCCHTRMCVARHKWATQLNLVISQVVTGFRSLSMIRVRARCKQSRHITLSRRVRTLTQRCACSTTQRVTRTHTRCTLRRRHWRLKKIRSARRKSPVRSFCSPNRWLRLQGIFYCFFKKWNKYIICTKKKTNDFMFFNLVGFARWSRRWIASIALDVARVRARAVLSTFAESGVGKFFGRNYCWLFWLFFLKKTRCWLIIFVFNMNHTIQGSTWSRRCDVGRNSHARKNKFVCYSSN